MSKLVFFDVFSQLPGLAHVRKVKTSSCRSSILRSEMTTISQTQTIISDTAPCPILRVVARMVRGRVPAFPVLPLAPPRFWTLVAKIQLRLGVLHPEKELLLQLVSL